MMEHIFRNINDIRVFDVLTNFIKEDEAIDINEIMNILEYSEYKRTEVEDSVEHFVRQKIIGIKEIEVPGTSGCKLCKYLDKFKIPRFGEHETHVPENTEMGTFQNYYLLNNPITGPLISAVFAHSFKMAGMTDQELEKEVRHADYLFRDENLYIYAGKDEKEAIVEINNIKDCDTIAEVPEYIMNKVQEYLKVPIEKIDIEDKEKGKINCRLLRLKSNGEIKLIFKEKL